MNLYRTFNFQDPMGLYARYSTGQCFIEPGTAILLGSEIAGGSSLAGGLLGGKKSSTKTMSTFSKNQKNMDRVIYDLLMGVTRDAKGREVSRDPWVLKALQKKPPQVRGAPFTQNQQNVMAQAAGMVNKVGNPTRPDPAYLQNLRMGVLPSQMNPNALQKAITPKTWYAAAGAVAKPGDQIVVGEDGPEKLHVLEDGTVVVEPNPQSVSSPGAMAQAMEKSQQAQKQFGANRGMVAGGALDPRRKYKDYYVDYNAPISGGSYWTTKDSTGATVPNAWSASAKKDYENWLAEQAKNADWLKANSWYSDWMDPKSAWAGDISKVPYITGQVTGKPKGTGGTIHTGYATNLQNWWNTLPVVTGNTDVANLMKDLDVNQYNDFNAWYQDPTKNKYYNRPAGQVVMRNGMIDFDDPYAMNAADVRNMLADYQKYYTSEGGPGYVAPEPAKADWSGLMQQIGSTEGDYSAFNNFLKTYRGGTLSGKGMAWDPTTNQWNLQADASLMPGMTQAVQDYLAQKAAGTSTGTGTGTTTTTTQPETTVGTNDQLNQILSALSSYTNQFDPTQANANFDAAVYNPSVKAFNENTMPGIRESFAGADFFGSGREQSEVKARTDLESALAGYRGDYLQSAEEAHKNRGLSAANSMMSLYSLPSEVMATKASTDQINAATANIFNNMAWTDSLNDASLTNQSLTSLALLWSLFEPEQQYNQETLNAAMMNYINADGGINWQGILSLMMGTPYNDQTQTAVVS